MDLSGMELNPRSGVPFYRQVVDQVSDLVRSGELAPGARLPSVRQLSRDLLVSLITVRRAYEELEKAGFLERRQGKGTFVREGFKEEDETQVHKEALEEVRSTLRRAQMLGVSREMIEGELDEVFGSGSEGK